MDSQTLTLTADELRKLVEKRIVKILTPQRVKQIAEEQISQRIGMLTLEEAMSHLKCNTPRQLTDFCREYEIPIQHIGQRRRFILVTDIQAAQRKSQLKAGAL